MLLSEWQKYEKPFNDLIIQASTILEEEEDGWQNFPIGMCFHFIKLAHLGRNLQVGNHSNLVLCSINTETDQKRRGNTPVNRLNIVSTLHKNGIRNTILNPINYYLALPKYKFVISPEGNGIDCHRHYEALIAGCIPIIEKNPLTEEKYKNMPVLWTIDYSEITPQYLNKKYDEMINKEYDFSKLFLSRYSSEQQKEIKKCGNYWCRRILNKEWYLD